MSDKQYTHHDDRTALEAQLQKLGVWLGANATFLIYGLAAVLAVTAGVVYMQRQPPENADASAQLLVARQPQDFQSIADSVGDSSPLGHWTRLRQANSLLNSGIRTMFTNREEATAELEQADAAFERLDNTSGLGSDVHERVLLGKAKLAETRCDGSDESIEAALVAWQRVLDEYPDSLFREHATDRIERLNDPGTKAFYAGFVAYEPKPEDDLRQPGFPASDVPGVPDGAGSEGTESLILPDLENPLYDAPSEGDAGSDESGEPQNEPAGDEPVDNAPPAAEPADEPTTDEPTTDEPDPEEPAADAPPPE